MRCLVRSSFWHSFGSKSLAVPCVLSILWSPAGAPVAQAADGAPKGDAAAATGDELVDRIVAVVDGRPILYSDVKAKVDKGPLVVVSEYPATESAPQFDRALQ